MILDGSIHREPQCSWMDAMTAPPNKFQKAKAPIDREDLASAIIAFRHGVAEANHYDENEFERLKFANEFFRIADALFTKIETR